jgi:hypothetical protein
VKGTEDIVRVWGPSTATMRASRKTRKIKLEVGFLQEGDSLLCGGHTVTYSKMSLMNWVLSCLVFEMPLS